MGKEDEKWWGDFWVGIGKGYEPAIIPISMYNGSGPRKSAEKGQAHVLSPLLKTRDMDKIRKYVAIRNKKFYPDPNKTIAQQK